MATQTMVTCDAPGCGKDITKGEKFWRLLLHAERILLKDQPEGAPHPQTVYHDAVNPQLATGQKHFCGYHCVAVWAAWAEAEDTKVQSAFVTKMRDEAKAKVLADEASALAGNK